MKNTIKLLIPLGLGMAAVFINYLAVSSSSKSADFIVATRDIKVGEEFSSEVLERASIPERFAEHLINPANKGESAILYADIAQLESKTANRNIQQGDLLFYPDVRPEPDLKDNESMQTVQLGEVIRVAPGLMRVGDEIEFRIPPDPEGSTEIEKQARWIGPFRLVGVGRTLVRDVTPEESDANVRNVTVAVERGSAKAQELGTFVDRVIAKKADLIAIRIFHN